MKYLNARLVVSISLNNYVPLVWIKKEKTYICFGNVLTKLWIILYFSQVYTSWERNKEKSKPRRLFAEHKASIFTPKFGKFLWRIWKIKSSTSSLNLCQLNQLAQATTMEATEMNHRSSHQKCSAKKGDIRSFTKFTWKRLCQSLFFNKAASQTFAQVFSCEFCEISKHTFFTEHKWATASGTRNPA